MEPKNLMTIPYCTFVTASAFLISQAVMAAEPVQGKTRDGVTRIDLLPPGPGNPRNSEGDFIVLNDGRVLLIYTHFTGGAGDDAAAHLASRASTDGGLTWSRDDEKIVSNEAGHNVMSVSLNRLKDGRIALFYLRKESATDCRPVVRMSSDEAKTWGEAIEIVPDKDLGYYVLNNDRVLQLGDGRLVVPLAQHYGEGWPKWTPNARMVCYVSDDGGQSWHRGEAAPAVIDNQGREVMLQEPGIVELNDGRLLMLIRTNAGSQYASYSTDRGLTWSEPSSTSLQSPRSPATVERIPGTETLLLAWNDHRNAPGLGERRTPLQLAISHDNGQTWQDSLTLESDLHGWYCYTAMAFVGDHVLLAYCAGDRRENNGLAETRITRIPLAQIVERK